MKKILLIITGIFLSLLCLLAFVGIYKFVYGLLKPNETPTFFGYSDYIVNLDSAGIYTKGDLVIVKSDVLYESGDYVLYNYSGSLMLEEVTNVNLDNYSLKSGIITSHDDIVGKAIFDIHNFEKIYNIMINPIIIIIILIGTSIYYYLLAKGKVKE